MKTKSKAVKRLAVKAAGEPVEGIFEGYASVFGSVDSYGDKVVKGAFADSLKEMEDAGTPIPVYYSHQMGGDPLMNIGVVVESKEDDHGLWVKCQLDIEENSKAAYVHKLLREKRITQMSFAYDVLEGGWIEEKDDDGRETGFFELRKLKLFEVSVVPIGANQETSIDRVKSAPTKADDSEEIPSDEDTVDEVDPTELIDSYIDALKELGDTIAASVETLSELVQSDESDDDENDSGSSADDAGDGSGDGEKRRKSLLARLNLENALRGGKES